MEKKAPSTLQIPLHNHMIVLQNLPPLDLLQDLLGGDHPHPFPVPGPGWEKQQQKDEHQPGQPDFPPTLGHQKMLIE